MSEALNLAIAFGVSSRYRGPDDSVRAIFELVVARLTEAATLLFSTEAAWGAPGGLRSF
jgi:hypothetical protein